MPAARKRRRTRKPRCAFIEEDKAQCQYRGEGNPPLCGYHAEQVEIYDDIDPTTAVIGGVVDWLRGKRGNEVVSGFRDILGSYLDQQTTQRPNGHAPPPPWEPPHAPAPPPPPSEDPREVLGFPPDVQLTEKKIRDRKKALATIMHPDLGGSTKSMQRLNIAAAALLSELS